MSETVNCQYNQNGHCTYARCFHFVPTREKPQQVCCNICDKRDFCDTLCFMYVEFQCSKKVKEMQAVLKPDLAYSEVELSTLLRIPPNMIEDFLRYCRSQALIVKSKKVNSVEYFAFRKLE